MKRGNALDDGQYGFLPSAAWAWECLRRNPSYRKEYFSITNRMLHRVRLHAGGELIRLRHPHQGADKWGLNLYEDPRLCANHAQVFWHPEVFHKMLNVVITTSKKPNNVTTSFKLSDLCVRKSILDWPGQPWQVRVFAKGVWFQLQSQEPLVILESSRLEIKLCGMDDARTRLITTGELVALFEGMVSNNPGHVPTNNRLLKRYLTAYDIKSGGGTYRDIAIALDGIERVKEDWNPAACYLKDRARRAFKKGKSLVEGEYLTLLA